MFKLVEDKKAKVDAQETFKVNLRTAWSSHKMRVVSWRSGDKKPGKAEMNVAHNNQFWFATVKPHSGQKTQRYWNSVGIYDERSNLQITVELNIPTESNSENVSGFFAIDERTGAVCLMHDGGIGGGRKGIGKVNFWAWLGTKPEPVITSDGKFRHGIVVTEITSNSIGENVGRFLQTVDRFKQAVKNGEINGSVETTEKKAYEDYFREFSGRKKGQRAKDFEYISRHGDIVHGLKEWRQEQSHQSENERIVKNPWIDLGVANELNQLVELYEVKTNTDRQTLYTAIGQLVVHGVGHKNVRCFIVVPADNNIPVDVTNALAAHKITVLRFKMAKTVSILSP